MSLPNNALTNRTTDFLEVLTDAGFIGFVYMYLYTGDIRTYFIHREIYVCTLYTGDICMYFIHRRYMYVLYTQGDICMYFIHRRYTYVLCTQELDTVRCTRACVSDW